MRKLVFIDDDPVDHFLMKHLLKDKHYFDTTTYTPYGSLVLDYIEEFQSQPNKLPDVIILDLNMPQLSGWEFLERMEAMQQNVSKDIQVYVLSSSLRPSDMSTSSRYSFVTKFISKPMQLVEVERIVAETSASSHVN